jgi:hypothetical protein
LKPAEEISLQYCKDQLSTVLPFSTQLYRALNAMKIVNMDADNIRKKIIQGLSQRFLSFEWDR